MAAESYDDIMISRCTHLTISDWGLNPSDFHFNVTIKKYLCLGYHVFSPKFLHHINTFIF